MHDLNWRCALLVCALAAACGGGGLDPDGDADGDTISNAQEEADEVNTDGDALPDYLDLDSDGDGAPDELEAGDADLATEPIDTDDDGVYDFRDTDSDGDNILDTDELGADFGLADTDDDGTPDLRDTDSDGDGIPDSIEAGDFNPDSLPLDSDGDGIADFRDLDSDNDCIPDAIEAGPNPEAPLHSDADGKADYRDLDSDDDGLPDSAEDLNCNGIVEANESSPTNPDTDGDGTPDLIEVVAGSDPNDATDNIPPGDFYFVLPYMGPGDQGVLDFATDLRQADIFFSVDTTGSFGEEISEIQNALTTTIIPGVAAVIPDAAFGVGRFEDFPLDPFGLAGDVPYQLIQAITTDQTDISDGVTALGAAAGGLDTPEAGFEALYQWATGVGFPAFGYAPFAPPGIGGVGFRADSLPIIIHITDAISHAASDYPFAGDAHSYGAVVQAVNTLGIRVIGIDSLENENTANDPRAQLEDLAIDTLATIPPDVNDECATGVGGALRPAVLVGNGDLGCPLVFDVLPDGTGLGALIVDAIAQLATLGTFDISTDPIGQTMGLSGEVLPPTTTTADFIVSITPVAPPPPGATIDGDVFRNVTPGNTVEFDLVAFNDFVMPTLVDQLFAIDVHILGDAVTLLDNRRVFVIVPRDQIPIE